MDTYDSKTKNTQPEKAAQKMLDETKVVQDLFEEAEQRLLSNMGMWMRYNYVLNQVVEALAKGCEEKDLNWDIINKKLYTNVDPYDNNIYTEVHSLQELQDARDQCIDATIVDLAWKKGVCKDCHQEFTLSYSECSFFKNKGLALPKRCKCCRDKRKQGGNK